MPITDSGIADQAAPLGYSPFSSRYLTGLPRTGAPKNQLSFRCTSPVLCRVAALFNYCLAILSQELDPRLDYAVKSGDLVKFYIANGVYQGKFTDRGMYTRA